MSDLCACLHLLLAGLPHHRFPLDLAAIPLDGIYVLFESGELAHGTDRIVRVGTHRGEGHLRSRLQQHFVHENKDRSIFRKNIGRALLNRDGDPFLAQWEWDLTTRKARDAHAGQTDAQKQQEVERRVSGYIQSSFQVVVLRVDDRQARLDWESKIISTVSLCGECRPSLHWLGQYSSKERIRLSGLWLVNELYKQGLFSQELDELERLARLQ